MPVMALDLGGTKLAAALFSEEGKIFFQTTVPLAERTGSAVKDLVLQQVDLLFRQAKEKNVEVTAMGICVPGIAYARTGNVWAPNITGWEDYPLLAQLRQHVNNPDISIHIDSDRACYILGETWQGNARGCGDAIYLAVGTGIGAGILVNHQVLRGAHDIGGAIGWMALNRSFDDNYISCGCFEYHASGPGLENAARDLLGSGRYPDSIFYTQKPGQVTAKELFAACETGDPLAKEVLRQAIVYWGMAVANLVSLFNPEKIIFGGGVFGPALGFLDEIYEEAKKWAQPISIGQVKLEGSALGQDAGLYGAARLALST